MSTIWNSQPVVSEPNSVLKPGPKVIKKFSCSTQPSMKFVLLINLKLLATANSFLLNIAEHEISLIINMKMPTFVGIFISISRENFMLSWVEHEKRFITSGPGLGLVLGLPNSTGPDQTPRVAASVLGCIVCLNYRKLRVKWNGLKSTFRTIFPAYIQRQSTHHWCQRFDFFFRTCLFDRNVLFCLI